MSVDRAAARVLLLTGTPLDGPESPGTDLARELLCTVPHIEYAWFRRWWGRPRRADDAPGGQSVSVVSREGTPSASVRLQILAAALLAARRTDLVHAVLPVGPGFAAFSRTWPRVAGRRPVLHTVPAAVEPADLAGCRPLGRTVALSDATARQLTAAGFGDVRVVNPSIRLDLWPLRRRQDRTPPMVLAIGDGGTEEAMLSAGVAARAGAQFQLVLALTGDGPGGRQPEDLLRGIAAREGLLDMEVLRCIGDLPGLLAAADVLLYVPRRMTGRADVPPMVLRALATGRPVILSDLPQFAGLSDTVLRTPAADPHHTGHLLRQLLDRPWWWDRIAERGRTTVAGRFGSDRCAAAYTRLYRELLG
ncbi:glycosyltransferase [Streptomyces sp. t39]|uniref:glycosyltransferase n=1 Tax=Streptomyces sp. t39 TaxID=1828156 RepID=UPI0011CE4305|nr:glycosyltransferase [Streptomyces sp. t39]TXS52133.1 glycosyltransferase family 1 protein [Streptomyces sp. t39]